MPVLPNEEYTVGWICALPGELAAARAMLSEYHGRNETQDERDRNVYHLGSVAGHNVAIACLPAGVYGTTSAAIVAEQMLFTFRSIRFGLMVGIGGGIPSRGQDIRLGDVVVSKPEAGTGGVVQYDFGKVLLGGDIERTGSLNKPPLVLLNAVTSLQAEHLLSKMQAKQKSARLRTMVSYPGAENDRLFEADCEHKNAVDGDDGDCNLCDHTRLVKRKDREDSSPVIHYGIIASGNKVIKDSKTRDRIGKETGALCFEMEAAGLMDSFPCIVVRGICDYSDSHKNKDWQLYAAVVAAAYAKELLTEVLPYQIQLSPMAIDAMKIKKEVRQIKDGVQGMNQKLATYEGERQRKKMLHWLTDLDFGLRHSDIFATRQEGTVEWFIHSPEFQAWRVGKGETLYCPGIAGAGKTVIVSAAIEHLRSHFQYENSVRPHIGIVFIYNRWETREQYGAIHLLSAILRQLCQQRPKIPECVEKLYKNHESLGTRPGIPEVIEAILPVARYFDHVYIIVDALDECTDETCRTLVSTIRGLQKQHCINLMVTTRIIQRILDQFDDSSCSSVRIEAHRVDIEKYLDANIAQILPLNMSQDVEFIQKAKHAITVAAGGIFLLARLHLHSLQDKTVKDVRMALDNIPQGKYSLRQAYGDVMRRIQEQAQSSRIQLARRVLSWITLAQRVLTIRELQHALAVEPGETRLDEDNIRDVTQLASVCMGLVVVQHESNTIELAHFTIKEYMDGDGSEWLTGGHLDIASTSLRYLSFDEFKSGPSRTKQQLRARRARNGFFDYASNFWFIHTAKVQQEVKDTVFTFLRNSKFVSASYQAMNVDLMPYGDDLPSIKVAGMHMAAYHGLEAIAKDLIENKELVDILDHEQTTPLILAADAGHQEIVKTFLVHGANVNHQNRHKETALRKAASRGHEQCVDLLLQSNASVDLSDRNGMTPLHLACLHGHIGVAQLLLRSSANTQASTVDGFFPLQIAADNGHVKIVQNLLREGALAESCSEYSEKMRMQDLKNLTTIERRRRSCCYPPLLIASKHGQHAIVKLLVEHGASVNAMPKDGHKISFPAPTTALHLAASNGHATTVKILVEHGADFEKMDWEGQTPLFVAARGGHVEAMRILIKRGANCIGVKGQKQCLHLAAEGGHAAAVRLLLEHGVGVDTLGIDRFHVGEDVTALFIASREGHVDVVQTLLEWDADVMWLNLDSTTALWAAATGRGNKHQLDVVNLLLKRTDIINAKLKHGMTVLDAAVASHWCSEAMIRVLIEGGANVENGSALLHAAASSFDNNGSLAIISLLLEHGADIHAIDEIGETVLHKALPRQEDTKLIELLLEKGAAIEAGDCNGDTALHHLVRRINKSPLLDSSPFLGCYDPYEIEVFDNPEADERLLQMVLGHRAEVIHARNNKGETVLHLAILGETGSELDVESDVGSETGSDTASDAEFDAEFDAQLTAQLTAESESDSDSDSASYTQHSARYSSRNREQWLLQLLLDWGADCNAQCHDEGFTSIHLAAQKSTTEVARLLLEKGADFDKMDFNGKTALYYAKRIGSTGMVATLLAHGAAREHDDTVGRAAEDLHEEKIRIWLEGQSKEVHENREVGKDNQIDIHVRDANGFTALHRAAYHGHARVVALLLQHGAADDIDIKTASGHTALDLASRMQLETVMRLLLDFRAQVNPTAVEQLIRRRRYDLVQLLLDHETEDLVEAASSTGNYDHAVHAAVDSGNVDILGLLLDRGASPNALWKRRQPVLLRATEKGHESAVRVLLQSGADVNQAGKEKTRSWVHGSKRGFEVVRSSSALHHAVQSGNVEVVQTLLEYKARVDTMDRFGCTVWHVASHLDHADLIVIVQLLLHYNTADADALYLACENDKPAMVLALLEAGVPANARYRGATALHAAARYGRNTAFQLLLQYGADPNAKSCSQKTSTKYIEKITLEGVTALHLAASGRQCGIIGVLLKYHVLVDTADQKGRTALHFAAQAPINSFKHCSCFPPLAESHSAVPVMQLLLDSGADIDARDNYGKTALHFAASNNYYDIVQVLLQRGTESGPDIEARDNHGKTALHFAASNNYCDIVQFLLEHGADSNSKTESGQQPLHLVASFAPFASTIDNQEIGAEIARQLLHYGAIPSVTDDFGWTPLHYAALHGRYVIISLLITEHEVHVDQKTVVDGITALHIASARNNDQAVRQLLALGADVKARDYAGQTCFHHLAIGDKKLGPPRTRDKLQATVKKSTEIVQTLFECGLSTQIADNKGQYPVHLAVKSNRDWIRDLLSGKE